MAYFHAERFPDPGLRWRIFAVMFFLKHRKFCPNVSGTFALKGKSTRRPFFQSPGSRVYDEPYNKEHLNFHFR